MKNSLSDNLRPIDDRNLSDRIANEIRRLISNGEMKPLQKLPTEGELCSLFQVGRTTIREAKRMLSAGGLISSKQGAGSFITENANQILAITPDFVFDGTKLSMWEVFECRRIIEVNLTALAAERATAEDVERIKDALDEMEINAGDLDKFVISDLNFHFAIASASKSKLLGKMYLEASEIMRTAIRSIIELPAVKDNAMQKHWKIFAAIKTRNVQKARRASEEHLDEVWESIKAYLEIDDQFD